MESFKRVLCPNCIGDRSMKSMTGIVHACLRCDSKGYLMLDAALWGKPKKGDVKVSVKRKRKTTKKTKEEWHD